MALNVSTTKEIIAIILGRLETAIGQTAPASEKSFLRVLSTSLALMVTALTKFAVERTRQNLAETATGKDLDALGTNYGVTRRAGVAATVTLTTTGTNGVDVTPLLTYVSDFSGVRYVPTETVTVAGGVASFDAQAEITGEDSNLTAGDTLTIESQVAGLSAASAYSATVTTGTDREDDTDYRRRVLTEIRTVGGGGNSADYRTWAEAVSDVQAAFPYSGRPAAEGADQPGDRTVYVQSASATDGIANSTLQDAVRAAITTDPDTGLSRVPLGMTDDTLFIESITRTTIYVRIEDLTYPVGQEADVKARAEAAIEEYFADVYPWVSGLDLDTDVNDTVTGVSVANAIQPVFDVTGSSASRVRVATGSPTGYVTSYEMDEGELIKLGSITWA